MLVSWWRWTLLGLGLMGTVAAAEPWQVGGTVQIYPAGVIVTAQALMQPRPHHEVALHIGYNRTERQDFGEHDDESGGGPGVGLAWRWFPRPDHWGWLIGTRIDLWRLDIDWRDAGGPNRSGETTVVVLLPTAVGGYRWRLADPRWTVEATVALGAEINTHTRGEDVGEGAIFLGGVGMGYRF